MSVATVIFAALFLAKRVEVRKAESKSEALAGEVLGIKCSLAQAAARESDALAPLTKESIVEFLRREKTSDIDASAGDGHIQFKIAGERYYIDCIRLPHQFVFSKGSHTTSPEIRWDVLEQADVETMKEMVMVKMHVNPGLGYDYLIVSTTRTLAWTMVGKENSVV